MNGTIHASPESPPAFLWEQWYESIGGRHIRIAEVESYLKKIYEDQYKRFDGKPAEEKYPFSSASEASMHIKSKALEFGADITGICEIEPSDIYRGRTVTEKYAVAVGQRMRWREFQVVPSRESA